jgi:XTP/dITP diphosphohydrolase
VIVIASRNAGKIAEIRALPAAAGLELVPISDFANAPEVVEDGVTFEENAVVKAVRTSLWLKRAHGIEPPVVGEDAGLLVETLLGWPGVQSARIADNSAERIALVLERLGDHFNRSAQFVAYTAMAVNGNLLQTWRGSVSGRILHEPRGSSGFGYDPVFEDTSSGRTFAEMTREEKNQRSHRFKAWTAALEHLQQLDGAPL